jgi:hypothetical protein
VSRRNVKRRMKTRTLPTTHLRTCGKTRGGQKTHGCRTTRTTRRLSQTITERDRLRAKTVAHAYRSETTLLASLRSSNGTCIGRSGEWLHLPESASRFLNHLSACSCAIHSNTSPNASRPVTVADPVMYTPESRGQPAVPLVKRRRAKRTEEERIQYLREDPYVEQFEAYRVLCASCDKWIRLRPNSTYCSIPWDAHRKSCLAKKA